MRNGEVCKAEIGGSGWLQPLVDQVIILPTAMQLSKFNLELFDYQQKQKSFQVDLELNWRIVQPEMFYRSFFSIRENVKYEKLMQLYNSYLRDLLANKTIDDMYRKSRSMMNELKNTLNEKLKDDGIVIESLEIETVTIL